MVIHHIPMNEQARVNVPEWTVSELSAALRKTVEDAFGYVRVRGEISGYRGRTPPATAISRSRTRGAKIEAVIWRTAFARLRLKPEEGLEVFVTGRLTTYPGQSTYQIVIETLEPAGLGALMALVEERKKKLAAEGLFDAASKQLLPFLPELIGVVTSPTGAVIRDILHRLADRFPRHVIVWPVRVQGDGSADEVAAAIHGFNALVRHGPIRRPDLLIVARGGGSLEDLWSFNDESVVRAVAASMIPLIAAVGHETDVTLIDFAADVRAPTPSAAAELAVPVRLELIARVDGLTRRSLACWRRGHEARRAELRAAIRAMPTADELFALPRQRLDHARTRLPRALIANAQIHHQQFSRVAGRLGPQILRARMARCCELVAALVERARRADNVARLRRRERLSDGDRAAGGELAGERRRPSQPHRAAARARRRARRAQRPRGATIAAPARDLGRALRAAAQRALPPRRAGARFCAGARSRRPAAAASGGGERGDAPRCRVFRRPRARAGGRIVGGRGGQTAVRPGGETAHAPRRRRSGSGQPVRRVKQVRHSDIVGGAARP